MASCLCQASRNHPEAREVLAHSLTHIQSHKVLGARPQKKEICSELLTHTWPFRVYSCDHLDIPRRLRSFKFLMQLLRLTSRCLKCTMRWYVKGAGCKACRVACLQFNGGRLVWRLIILLMLQKFRHLPSRCGNLAISLFLQRG